MNDNRVPATVLLAVVLVVGAAACAPKRLALPTGAGTPVTDFRPALDRASSACGSVRTLRTTIALSGRAGGQRMRGTLLAGLEPPDKVRLEGVAPFGPPAFILAARDGSATLLLPRDNRVLTGVSAADILEALAGIRVDPAQLRAILTGCVVAGPEPTSARGFDKGWMAVDIRGGTTVYLREQQSQWQIVAGVLPDLEVEYRAFENGLPRQLLITSRSGRQARTEVNLTLALSDVATNVTLNPAAFEVQVPRDAAPMTLAELRDGGPLGQR